MKLILYLGFLLSMVSLQVQAQLWTSYTTDNGLPSNNIYKVVVDTGGVIWCATDAGLGKFENNQWTKYTTANGLTYNTIGDITIDSKNRIWAAQRATVNYYRDVKKSLSYFENGKWITIKDYHSVYLLASNKDGLWGINWSGDIYKFYDDSATVSYGWTITSYSMHAPEPSTFFADPAGFLWEGDFWGIHCKNYKTGQNIYKGFVNTQIIDKDGFISYRPGSPDIVIDKSNVKWFAGKGIYTLVDTTWTVIDTSERGLYCGLVTVDNDNNIWFGSERKHMLWKYDRKKWVNYTIEDGLPDFDITSIITDKEGNKWISTTGGGIVKYSGKNEYLTISKDSIKLNSNSGFFINSNTNWRINSDQDWITTNVLTGLNSDTVIITATANPLLTERSAILTISGSGVDSKAIKLIQAANDITDLMKFSNNKHVKIYPNPVLNKLVICFPHLYSAYIEISSQDGRLLYNTTTTAINNEINMLPFNTGIYILKINVGKDVILRKIVKQ